MSDDRETPEGSRSSDRPEDRDPRDGPLGDLAAEVRERVGEERGGRRRAGGERGDEPSLGSRREGPLADVAAKVDQRRRRDGSDAFESVEVEPLDGERLWEQLADDDADEPTVSPREVATPDVSPGDDRDVRTISKDTCHGCPHLGDPPELACTHEGTEILAMPDADHFRVVDCPMAGDDEDVGTLGIGSDDAPADE